MSEPKLISADSHVNEPGDLWVERIDKAFRDRAPRVVENPPGLKPGAYFMLEGIPPIHLAQGMGAEAALSPPRAFLGIEMVAAVPNWASVKKRQLFPNWYGVIFREPAQWL